MIRILSKNFIVDTSPTNIICVLLYEMQETGGPREFSLVFKCSLQGQCLNRQDNPKDLFALIRKEIEEEEVRTRLFPNVGNYFEDGRSFVKCSLVEEKKTNEKTDLELLCIFKNLDDLQIKMKADMDTLLDISQFSEDNYATLEEIFE